MKKQEKKFVLVGFALLAAITMVLLPLAGCKNDSVPPEVEKQEQGDGGGSETDKNNTAAKLVSITVTPPERTVYSMGQEFDSTGMVVTATYNDGESKDVTDLATTNFGTVVGVKGLNKTVTVSYTEGDSSQTATFTIDVASYEFTETVQDVDSSYAGTMTGGNYKKFGDWPQIIKKEGVEIGAGTLVRGGLTYHVGSDGNYYVKAEEKANGTGTQYKYSNGDQVGQGGTSTKWFKVEPIVWRVLTESYNSTNHALLLAESILTGGIKWADSKNDYMESNIRKWLNGNSGTGENSDYSGTPGFLQTAFTADAQKLIADTTVDNSAASTNPASNPKQWAEGENPYASDTPTRDKVFLLSEKEATTESYGFATYSDSGKGNTRIRVTTDYAKATGAYQSSTEGYGGWWWLRSPNYRYEDIARYIYINGDAISLDNVYRTDGGVVPALSISLGGN